MPPKIDKTDMSSSDFVPNITFDRRKKQPFEVSSIIQTVMAVLSILAGIWLYSLGINNNYNELKSQIALISKQIDYLVKASDSFSDFRDLTKERLAKHDTAIAVMEQEHRQIKTELQYIKKTGGKYNEIIQE